MQVIKTCDYCGNQFVGNTRRAKFCSRVCYKKRSNETEKDRLTTRDAERAAKEAKKAKKPLWQLNAEARQAGMSYGQYQAARLMQSAHQQQEAGGSVL